MNGIELTGMPFGLHHRGRGEAEMKVADGRNRVLRAVVIGAGVAALGGCITVKAPEKPIVIELNIRVTAEVVYRLASDAAKTIENNKEVF